MLMYSLQIIVEKKLYQSNVSIVFLSLMGLPHLPTAHALKALIREEKYYFIYFLHNKYFKYLNFF